MTSRLATLAGAGFAEEEAGSPALVVVVVVAASMNSEYN